MNTEDVRGGSLQQAGSASRIRAEREAQKAQRSGRSGRRFVRLFKPKFAPLVRTGAKAQTVRPTPKRMPRPGDIFDGREWTGRPYASKQRKLIEAPIWKVDPTVICFDGIRLAGKTLSVAEEWVFAKADGFNTPKDLLDWFTHEHGLPFEGITIYWTPPLGGRGAEHGDGNRQSDSGLQT
jgi:hypothetical protein